MDENSTSSSGSNGRETCYKKNMFIISPDAKKKVYEMFDRTEEIINEDVETVKEWMRSQPHLPETMNDAQIRNFLSLNKFSVEKTKRKIDMYYTVRNLMPDLYSISNPKLERMQMMMDKLHIGAFPGALDGIHRTLFAKIKRKNTFSMEEFTMLLFDVMEVRLHEDFMFSDILVVDMEHITLNDVKKIPPGLIKKLIVLYQKVYSFRMKNMYFLNSSSFIASILAILKAVMKPKLFGRVQVYSDSKILHEVFPNEQIPEDYGGSGRSLQKLSDEMRQKFLEYRERFDVLDTLRVNESLRPEKLDNDDVLGFYGNFRKLDID